jgi:hypothetical protein
MHNDSMQRKNFKTLSLRALMIVLTITCVAAAYCTNSMRQRAQLIAAIREHGGGVHFSEDPTPTWGEAAAVKLLGQDAAGRVTAVFLTSQTPLEVREKVARRGWQQLQLYLCPSGP